MDATIEKRVRCPTCKTIMTVAGNPGETVTSTCPTCGFRGIIRFAGEAQKTAPIIRIEQLTKTFGRFTAVDHITLMIHSGEIFGLLGPNGSGKTTDHQDAVRAAAPYLGFRIDPGKTDS